MRKRFNRVPATLLAFAMVCLLAASTLAAPPPPERLSDYEVKAAYLFNFARFVTWPEAAGSGPGTPIRIGIYGEDPFGGILDRTLEGKTIGGRPLVIERIDNLNPPVSCHLLFIGPAEESGWPRILEGLGTTPVLTVGDFEGFTAQGGMIRFHIEQNKVRFEVNPRAAQRAGLKISSKLLSLAEIYRE